MDAGGAGESCSGRCGRVQNGRPRSGPVPAFNQPVSLEWVWANGNIYLIGLPARAST